MPKQQTVPTSYNNGFLNDLDSRTAVAKEMRERYQALTNDLGGLSALSYQQRSLAERVLWLEYWLASQERTLADGGEFDVGKWTQAANSLQGIFAKLGLSRVAREVNLSDIIERSQSKTA